MTGPAGNDRDGSLHGARFAARASGFHPSPVRAVFEVSMLPGMISLAGGNPDLSALPMAEIADAARTLLVEEGLDALQYGSGAGTETLRQAICEVMAIEGAHTSPANVQVTAGSQMALELVTTMFCDPGDVVLAEGPTYVGALSVFEGLQAEVAHVAMDDDGLDPVLLQERIDEVKSAGKTIKFLYTIPNFNNPAGVSLAVHRRQAVVDICRAENIAIVEDNPYGMISFDGSYMPTLYSLDPDNVFYLGSFSKIFSPGVRIGWVVAPEQVRGRLQIAAEATTICPSMLSQMLVVRYVRNFDWRDYVEKSSATYAARCAATMAALEEHMPSGTTWTVPTGGFFTWITLPEGCSVTELLQPSIENGVVFVPGIAFYADGEGTNQLRVAFSFEDESMLEEGIKRLGATIATLAGDTADQAG